MEGDCLTSSIGSSTAISNKRQSSVASAVPKHSRSRFDEDEDLRTEFSCPYCYNDYDLDTLGSHLEDQHCFESRIAVCPVCSARIWRDMAGHVTLQHGHLYKIHSQNRFRKSSTSSNSTISLLGQELKELHLQALIGDVSSTGTISSTIVESLLSSLGCKLPSSETGDTEKKEGCPVESEKDECLTCHQPNSRVEVSLTTEEREQRSKQAARRADFVQQIVLSTFMDDR
ncbi:hypothetical protein O6H91_16G035600 [Diphasiastrum complanatum]|uniref:Uncharacterized protein n=1 Tax=Diphasiastrum complanatum TaxID=34168 RepID=A0ACC2BBF1_DIPCM|nr:hypothetical protein O6H91_16G035600 [Diphasiastrum complanatum]